MARPSRISRFSRSRPCVEAEEKPRLVQQHDLVSCAVAADEAQSLCRDQGERRHGDALGAGVGLAGGAGVGQREPRRADRDHRALDRPSARPPRSARSRAARGRSPRARPAPRRPRGRRRRSPPRSRSITQQQAPLAGPDRVAHRAVDRDLPGRRRIAQQLDQVAGGQLLAQLGQADRAAGRACPGARDRPESSSTSTSPSSSGDAGRGRGRAWGRSRRPASRGAGAAKAIACAAIVLPRAERAGEQDAPRAARSRGASVGS